MARELYAREIFDLTVRDLEHCRIFKVKDPEHETEEHWQYLRSLIRLDGERHQSQAVPATELEQKLSQLAKRETSPSCSSEASYRTETFDEEKEKVLALQLEREAYTKLLADGGCASHPLALGFDILDNPGEFEDILWFWHFEGLFMREFRSQLSVWQDFRNFQSRMREKHGKAGTFPAYRDRIHRMQEKMSLPWTLTVYDDRSKQSRLEDWNEFRYLYYSKLGNVEVQEKPAKERLAIAERKLSDAEPRLMGSAFPEGFPRWDVVNIVVESENKREQAGVQVEVAQQKLQIARTSHESATENKEEAIKHAVQELEAAERSWRDVAETEQVKTWREGYELLGLQNGVVCARRELGRVQLHIRKWGVFLRWIDDQYLKVAFDCGYPTNVPACSALSSPSVTVSQRSRKGFRGTSLGNKRTIQQPAVQAQHRTRITKTPRVRPDRCHQMQLRAPSYSTAVRRSKRLREKKVMRLFDNSLGAETYISCPGSRMTKCNKRKAK